MENKRFIGLDVFRIICYMVVCAFHTTIHLGCDYGPFQGISVLGAVFMTAFFMMSGYVLFMSNNKIDLANVGNVKKFFVKRIIGIIPMYYISAIIYVVFVGKETVLQNIFLAPVEMLGLQSTFYSLFSRTHNGGTWFISCILICYLLYPYIQEMFKQIKFKTKMIILIVTMLIIMYAPIVVYVFSVSSIYSNPIYRIMEFLIGIALASMVKEFKENGFVKKYMCTWWAIILELFIFAMCISVGAKQRFQLGNYNLYSIVGLPLFSAMLISFSGVDIKGTIINKIIKYMGSLAYSVFLAQLFSNNICKKIIGEYQITSNLVKIALGWGVCIVIAIAMHELIEKRLTKFLKSKLIKVENKQ